MTLLKDYACFTPDLWTMKRCVTSRTGWLQVGEVAWSCFTESQDSFFSWNWPLTSSCLILKNPQHLREFVHLWFCHIGVVFCLFLFHIGMCRVKNDQIRGTIFLWRTKNAMQFCEWKQLFIIMSMCISNLIDRNQNTHLYRICLYCQFSYRVLVSK